MSGEELTPLTSTSSLNLRHNLFSKTYFFSPLSFFFFLNKLRQTQNDFSLPGYQNFPVSYAQLIHQKELSPAF